MASASARAFAMGALFVFLCAYGGPLGAQGPGNDMPAPASLRLEGAVQCLTAADLEREVQARSPRVQIVPERDGIPQLRLDVRHPPARPVRIELAVSWPDGRRSRRELAADSCAEATSAAAFLIAITLEPTSFDSVPTPRGATPTTSAGGAPTTLANPTESPAAAAYAAQPSAAGAASAPAARDETTPAPGTREMPDDGVTAEPESNAAKTDDGSFFELGPIALVLSGQLQAGAAPHVMYGLGLRALLPLHGRGRWAPALALSVSRVWTSQVVEPVGVADFQLSTAHLEVCPLGARTAVLTARACLGASLGSFTAQGSESYSPRSSARFWADLGSSLLMSVAPSPWFQVEAGAGIAAPLTRDEFAFRPDVFHRVAPLCWEAHLGAGVRFP